MAYKKVFLKPGKEESLKRLRAAIEKLEKKEG